MNSVISINPPQRQRERKYQKVSDIIEALSRLDQNKDIAFEWEGERRSAEIDSIQDTECLYNVNVELYQFGEPATEVYGDTKVFENKQNLTENISGGNGG